jgi:hypothetical protein
MFAPIEGVRILAFGHKARHGKDTAAKAIIAYRPMDIQRFAFADALKMYCRLVHGMTKKDAALLQRIGQEKRQEDPLFWVKQVYWSIEEIRPPVAVITDVRYQNEAEFLKSIGGTLINVTRYTEDGSVFIDPHRDPTHPSEIELDGYRYDHFLRNDRGQGDLALAASELFHEITTS